RQRHEETRGAEDVQPALADGEAHRARAERLSRAAQSLEERREAAGALRHANEERAEAARQIASAQVEPTRIRGNNGATAFVWRSWTFEVIEIDQVPREYMSLDVPVVRAAITQGGIRHIPGVRIFQAEGLRVRVTTSPHSQKATSEGEQGVATSKSTDPATHRSSDQRPGPRTPDRRGGIRSASDPRLVVPIKPIWGDQKVLRYYRQALASLQRHDAAEIAKFRAANAAIEARLRRKLPQRMEEIDFFYGGSRVSPEAGEGASQ